MKGTGGGAGGCLSTGPGWGWGWWIPVTLWNWAALHTSEVLRATWTRDSVFFTQLNVDHQAEVCHTKAACVCSTCADLQGLGYVLPEPWHSQTNQCAKQGLVLHKGVRVCNCLWKCIAVCHSGPYMATSWYYITYYNFVPKTMSD